MFTFEKPENWSVKVTSSAVTTTDPNSDAHLKISIRKRDALTTPEQVFRTLSSGKISKEEKLNQYVVRK